MDANSFQNERKGSKLSSDVQDSKQMDSMLMAGKRIEEWLSELDAIAKEVEVELVSRDIGCHYIEVLEAVNKVLFESRGFKRSAVVDSKCSYLHSVLSSRCGSGNSSCSSYLPFTRSFFGKFRNTCLRGGVWMSIIKLIIILFL